MPARNAEERRAIASIAALSRSARESGADRMAAANRTFRDSFNTGHQCRLCKTPVTIDQTLPAEEIVKRGYALYRAHMKRMALARVRNARQAAELAELEAEAAGGLADVVGA